MFLIVSSIEQNGILKRVLADDWTVESALIDSNNVFKHHYEGLTIFKVIL